MAPNFYFGAPNISAGYGVAYLHLMVLMFSFISLSGVIHAYQYTQYSSYGGDYIIIPISIVCLVLTILSILVQVGLILGLLKRIRPLLIVWIVVESITALVIFIGTITLAALVKTTGLLSHGWSVLIPIYESQIIAIGFILINLIIWMILIIFGAFLDMKNNRLNNAVAGRVIAPGTVMAPYH